MELDNIYNSYFNKYGTKQKKLDGYYRDDPNVIPIYSRKPKTDLKSNYHTNLHIDFAGTIIDFKVGYMGKNIETSIDANENAIRNIREFEFINNSESLDAESLRLTSTSGLSHRLLYLKNGELRAKNIEGWKVVYDYVDDIYDAERAYYFYTTTGLDGQQEERCDVYDSDNIIHFTKSYTNKRLKKYKWIERPVTFTIDGETITSSIEPHLLGFIPIFPILNNEQWLGDFDKAMSTMDTYDEIMSDLAGEIKSIRGNYLILTATPYTEPGPDGEPISVKRYLKENNLIVMPVDEEGKPNGDVKVIDINIPDKAIQNSLYNLRQHIFEESSSVDVDKITNTSDARVFTIKTMLMNLENNCKTTENFFKRALRRQYRILSFYLENSGQSSFDYRDIKFTFHRNFPADEQAMAQTLSILMTTMSPEDAYRIAGFEDPQGMAQRYEDSVGVAYEPRLEE